MTFARLVSWLMARTTEDPASRCYAGEGEDDDEDEYDRLGRECLVQMNRCIEVRSRL